jgi:hypothetical protein
LGLPFERLVLAACGGYGTEDGDQLRAFAPPLPLPITHCAALLSHALLEADSLAPLQAARTMKITRPATNLAEETPRSTGSGELPGCVPGTARCLMGALLAPVTLSRASPLPSLMEAKGIALSQRGTGNSASEGGGPAEAG